jgi:twitching motility protein PilJ
MEENRRNAALVIAEQANLLNLGRAVRGISRQPRAAGARRRDCCAQRQTGGSARQNAYAAQLMMLTQRMAKNANAMLAEALIDPRCRSCGKDTNGFRDILQGLLRRRGPAHPACPTPSCAASWARWKRRSRVPGGGGEHLGNQQRLVSAKRASFELLRTAKRFSAPPRT